MATERFADSGFSNRHRSPDRFKEAVYIVRAVQGGLRFGNNHNYILAVRDVPCAIAARLAPDRVGQMHQSLHHLVADAPWDDEAVMRQVRAYGWAAMRQHGPIQAWIIDDT